MKAKDVDIDPVWVDAKYVFGTDSGPVCVRFGILGEEKMGKRGR